MIASENFAPRPVLQLQGGVLTNKYAEGLPNSRMCNRIPVRRPTPGCGGADGAG
jgi:hypothetical protein